jgi:hypothetical protein
MDGGTVATAAPSHSHDLESPLCHTPPSHLPPNVDCRILLPPPIAANAELLMLPQKRKNEGM